MQIDWMVVLLLVFMAVQTIVNFSQGRRLRKLKAESDLHRDCITAWGHCHLANGVCIADLDTHIIGVDKDRRDTFVHLNTSVGKMEQHLSALEKHLGIELTTEPAKPEKQFYRKTR